MIHQVVRVSRAKESQIRAVLGEFHVLTYAEEGFSPLCMHARRLGVDPRVITAFAEVVNGHGEPGTLHPMAPLSAVPRELVRDRQSVDDLAASIGEFLRTNSETIKAPRVLLDFRMPAVPAFAIMAMSLAIETSGDSHLHEVLILEM
jgi:hypothetical protein